MSMCRCLSCHNRQSSQYKAKGQTACERLECGESATREKCEAEAGFVGSGTIDAPVFRTLS